MRANYCQSAWAIEACKDCKHNPANQMGQARGPTITPKVKKGGKCPYWAAKPEGAK